MLINGESRGSRATLQQFQTSIVLIVVMMRRSLFGGGNRVVSKEWDEVQSQHVHLNKSFFNKFNIQS